MEKTSDMSIRKKSNFFSRVETYFDRFQPRTRHALVYLLLAAAALLAYINCFSNPFYTDDWIFFNKAETDLRYFFCHFLPNRDQILGIQRMQGEFFYRPFSYAIPSLVYAVFETAPWGHHLVNIFLLALGGWAVYWLVISLAGDFILGMLAGLLYVVHPINGVVVNFVTAGVFGLQAFLMVFAVLAVYQDKQNRAAVYTLLAIFCHEMAMAIPFYAVAMLKFKGMNWKEIWKKTWKLWTLLAVYFLFRLFFISWKTIIFNKVQHYEMNGFEYLASQAKIIFWYAVRLFYPEGIVIIYSTAVVRDAAAVYWVLGGIIFAVLLGALIYYYRRNFLLSIGLIWFAIGFLPVTLASLFRPPHGLMIEPHWFVFSSIGFFILIASILKKMPLYVVLILISLWLAAGFRYNQLWSNEKNYCLTWLQEVPEMKAAAYVLGDIYVKEGNLNQAKYYFNRSLRGTYQDWWTYTKIGILAAEQKHWDEAKFAFQNAYRIAPNEPTLQNALQHFTAILKNNNN